MSDSESVSAKVRALVGQPTGGTGKPSLAPDPVNQPMIRHWAYAMADMNPVYIDPEFAASSRFGGIVSPPVMLQSWTMPSPKLEGIGERGGAPIEIHSNPTAFLDEAGYTSTVATSDNISASRPMAMCPACWRWGPTTAARGRRRRGSAGRGPRTG